MTRYFTKLKNINSVHHSAWWIFYHHVPGLRNKRTQRIWIIWPRSCGSYLVNLTCCWSDSKTLLFLFHHLKSHGVTWKVGNLKIHLTPPLSTQFKSLSPNIFIEADFIYVVIILSSSALFFLSLSPSSSSPSLACSPLCGATKSHRLYVRAKT